MSKEFIAWFDYAVPAAMWVNSEEERETLMVYCWLAWRDSRREAANSLGQ